MSWPVLALGTSYSSCFFSACYCYSNFYFYSYYSSYSFSSSYSYYHSYSPGTYSPVTAQAAEQPWQPASGNLWRGSWRILVLLLGGLGKIVGVVEVVEVCVVAPPPPPELSKES